MSKKKYYNDKSRKSDTSTVGEGIEALLDAYKLRSKFNETSVVANWEKLMGPQIAKRTTKIYVKNKKLFLQLNSAPLKNELSMAKTKLINLLNEGKEPAIIEDIVFL